ncbi:hypothetical protein EB796_000007 [Bugula neritina]|uniref:Uncharacterized protein n=1 Tax=Bugula neritina TaxID=10212 RepID=A0A7J7KU02_BUGNE|nr:hypothetical protein EB796_000007 [Bugula neritina]
MASGISPVETPEVPELSEKEKLSLSLNRLPPINSSQQTNPTLFLAQPVATQQANGQPAYILQPNGQSEYMLQANVQSANGQPGTSNVLQGQQLFATTSFTGEMTQQSVYILRPQPLPAVCCISIKSEVYIY